VLKDGWIRCKPGDRKLIDVALKCPGVQQVARNIVEPQALPDIMEFLSCVHRSPCLLTNHWRDHGQPATSVQKHDRSWLRSNSRSASREDAAILTSRHRGLAGSGVLSISASSSSQMSSRTFAPLLFSIYEICVHAHINKTRWHTFPFSRMDRSPLEEPNAGPVEPGLCSCD
jgi:hypothetical protein